VCPADEHFLGLPAGLFGCDDFGLVRHFSSNTDGIHQCDGGPAFSILKCDSANVQGIVNKIGRA
jgi:hypothetical protein